MGDDQDWTLDDDFVRAARNHEASGEQRISRAREVAATYAPRRRRRWVPLLVVLTSGVVLVLLLAPQAQPVREWLNQRSPTAQAGVALGLEPEIRLTVDGGTVAVPPLPDDVAEQPLGSPPEAPPGEGGYAFRAIREGAAPVAFDPCRPVHLVVNDALAPDDAAEHLQRALATISAASGLVFIIEGDADEPAETGRSPVQDRYGDRWAPVLLAWTSPAQVPELDGAVLGLGGGTIYDEGVPSQARFVSGLVYLDAPQVATIPASDRDRVVYLLLLHELGHLLGLDHVSDSTQVMHEGPLGPLSGLGDGDRRGLAKLGQGYCPTTA